MGATDRRTSGYVQYRARVVHQNQKRSKTNVASMDGEKNLMAINFQGSGCGNLVHSHQLQQGEMMRTTTGDVLLALKDGSVLNLTDLTILPLCHLRPGTLLDKVEISSW
jgi:hypothetical protein